MSEFDENKIRRLDLTVLLIFLGLMRARKASDVAGQLGLTNSSISHALRRLRDVFDDELFMRRPHGLEPTSFALAIEPDIRRSVEAVQAALVGPPQFDPALAKATLRVAANDREMATLVPSVFAEVANEAPHLDMAVQSLARDESLQRLAVGVWILRSAFTTSPAHNLKVMPSEPRPILWPRGQIILCGSPI